MRNPHLITPVRAGYLKIAGAAIMWGSLGLFIRAIHLPIPIIVFYRVLFATITIFLALIFLKRTPELVVKKYRILLVAIGILLALNWIFYFYSLVLTTIANAVLITYTAPIFIALLAPFFLKEKLESATIFSLGLSMIGMALIISPTRTTFGSQHLTGLLCAFFAAITYAIIVIAAKQMVKYLTITSMIFYENLVAIPMLSPFLLRSHAPIGLETWGLLLILGMVHTTLAPALYLSGLRQVKAQRAGILTYLDPVSATLFAALFLGEKPGLNTIIGGLLILGAGYIVMTRKPMEQPIIPD